MTFIKTDGSDYNQVTTNHLGSTKPEIQQKDEQLNSTNNLAGP